jgi:hypothetical protein
MKAKQQNAQKIEVLGRLLSQEISKPNLVVLTEECLVSILDLSQPDTPFTYSLYIKNEDQNANSKWPSLSFHINPEMQLSIFTNKDIDVFQWCTKTNIYFLEILLDEMNEINKNNFWKALEHCLCSITKKISIQRAAIEVQRSTKNYVQRLGQINDLEQHVKYMVNQLNKQRQKEEEEKELIKQMGNLKIRMKKVDDIINREVVKNIFEALGELYNYDSTKDELVNVNNKQKVMLKIYKLDSQRFDYALSIETVDSNPNLISIDKISENINGQMNSQCFCWMTSNIYIPTMNNCMGFLFDDVSESEKFSSIFEKCKYESKMGESPASAPPRYYTNTECFSSDEDEEEKKEEEEKKKKKKNKKVKKKKDRDEIMDLDDNYKEVESSSNNNNVFNKFCIDSLSNDRTFCVNNNNEIVVYKSNTHDDVLEKLSSLPVIQEYKGKNVVLNKGLLYKSEQNMLLLDQNNPYVLYQYDLPKGKIVNEWKTDKTSISDICPLKRNGQTTDEKVIYGVNPKSVFTLDERVNNKNNIADIKTYQTKTHANKIISTGEGQFVTGGEKGDLRFYDRIGIKAKNLISLYGDPIRHIEISSDDQYLLLTCDKYLLLINVTDKNGEDNAFKHTIKLDDRRGPVTLRLNTKDIAKYDLQDKAFTPARFDLNESGVNNIITSMGEYIIIWNYNDIRKGKKNYKIKKADDLVIDNYFKVGKGNKIIIGMPTKVRMQSLRKIK